MNLSAPLTATDRFARVIAGLCRSVAARIAGRAMEPPLIVLIWQRLSRINARVQALVARIRAGTLRPLRLVRPASRRAVRPPRPAAPPLPRGFAWLLVLVPYEAACYAGQMRTVLDDPEMAALIAATPRMGRLLRPLCRMLGLPADLCGPPAGSIPLSVTTPAAPPLATMASGGDVPPATIAAPVAAPSPMPRPSGGAPPPALRSDPVAGSQFFVSA